MAIFYQRKIYLYQKSKGIIFLFKKIKNHLCQSRKFIFIGEENRVLFFIFNKSDNSEI